MAYQLKEDQLARAGAWNIMDQEHLYDEYGDGGYHDTFMALKAQVDHVYDQYKDRWAYLPRKKEEMRQERNHYIMQAAFFLLIPLVMSLLARLFADTVSLSSIIVQVAASLSAVVCDVFLLPLTIRDFANAEYRYRELNRPPEKEKKNNTIITFADEEQFLRRIIAEYDRFYERIEREDLSRRKETDDLTIDRDRELTDREQAVLDKMRGMTVCEKYQASIGELRKVSGPGTLMIGIVIAAVICLVIYL